MFDLEEELIIGSERVPWLMWIQVMVTLLLLIVLYHIVVFSLGVDLSLSSSAAAPPQSAALFSAPALGGPIRLHAAKVRESQSVNNATGTSTSRRRGRKEDVHEKEGDSSQVTVSERSYHPCHYLGLARQAFFKCFGLEFPSKDSLNDTRQRKDQ